MFRVVILLSLFLLAGRAPLAPAAVDAGDVKKKLDTPVKKPVSFDPNTPLKEALLYISDAFDLKIKVDEAAFKKAGTEDVMTLPVVLAKQQDVALGKIVQLVLDQVKGTYTVQKDGILIVPAKK